MTWYHIKKNRYDILFYFKKKKKKKDVYDSFFWLKDILIKYHNKKLKISFLLLKDILIRKKLNCSPTESYDGSRKPFQ